VNNMSAEREQLSAAEIHARVHWPTVLQQQGVAREFLRDVHGPCPICGGKDRFRFDNRTGHGDRFCNVCRAGDGFQLLMRLHGWDFPTAIEHVLDTAGLKSADCGVSRGTFTRRTQPTCQNVAPLEWSERAESIWRRTLPLGSVAQTYLTRRGCRLPPADSDLRYLAPTDRYPPTLCARITDAVTGAPLSLHLTPLAADGSGRGDRRLLADHRKRGGVVRLWPEEAVTYGLGIAEGIETALAAAHLHAPMWSCIDAGNLTALPVLSGIDSLTIHSDHDDAGIRAAHECAHRWICAGREAVIYRPRVAGEDAADVARRLEM
jgi:putative DNA primase/helicase